ncbi:MAG: hypothetical protein GXO32_08425 [Crenarchaeota archaeon]|nr:hypothetical protein [Thermoproteota archaeon]
MRALKPLYTYLLNELSEEESCFRAAERTPLKRLTSCRCEACAYLWDCLAQLVRKGMAKRVGRGRFAKIDRG